MEFHLHIHEPDASPAALAQITAGLQQLKETIMSGLDDLTREIAEEKALGDAVRAALAQLVGLVTPLMDAASAAKLALADAQQALADANAANAALDAQMAAAATALNDNQTAVQAALDAIPPAPAAVPA